MKIQSFKLLLPEDYPSQYQEMVSKLATSINPTMQDIINLFNKNINITDNTSLVQKTFSVTVDSAGIPTTTTLLNTGLDNTCAGIQVINASNTTTTTNRKLTISAITAASPAVVTATGHGLINGDEIFIKGSDSTPSVDGKWLASVKDANTIFLPITVSGVGTVGTITKFNSPNYVPLITFSENSGVLTIQRVTGLMANNTYSLTVILYDVYNTTFQ